MKTDGISWNTRRPSRVPPAKESETLRKEKDSTHDPREEQAQIWGLNMKWMNHILFALRVRVMHIRVGPQAERERSYLNGDETTVR